MALEDTQPLISTTTMQERKPDPAAMPKLLRYTARNSAHVIVQAWANTPSKDPATGLQWTPAQITFQARAAFFDAFGFKAHFLNENPEPLPSDDSPFDITIPVLHSCAYAPDEDTPLASTSLAKVPAPTSRLDAPPLPLTPSENQKRKLRASSPANSSSTSLSDLYGAGHKDKKARSQRPMSRSGSSDHSSSAQLRLQWPRESHLQPSSGDEIAVLDYPRRYRDDLFAAREVQALRDHLHILWIGNSHEKAGDDKIWMAGTCAEIDAAVPALQSLLEGYQRGEGLGRRASRRRRR